MQAGKREAFFQLTCLFFVFCLLFWFIVCVCVAAIYASMVDVFVLVRYQLWLSCFSPFPKSLELRNCRLLD